MTKLTDFTECFLFSHGIAHDDGSVTDGNHTEVNAPGGASLTEVLRAFRDFLVTAGFDYVVAIDADCGDCIHSSEDE